MANIANETGWTFEEILWEHTEDQIDGYLYGSSLLNQKMIDEIKNSTKKKSAFKKPKTQADYEELDRRMKAMQNPIAKAMKKKMQ